MLFLLISHAKLAFDSSVEKNFEINFSFEFSQSVLEPVFYAGILSLPYFVD